MRLIHHGTGGTVTINDTEYLYADLLKIEPTYCAPYRFHTRVYERGKQHYATDGQNLLYFPLHDPYCERICSREGELSRLVSRLETENR